MIEPMYNTHGGGEIMRRYTFNLNPQRMKEFQAKKVWFTCSG